MDENSTKDLFKKYLQERKKLQQSFPKEALKLAENYDNQQKKKNDTRRAKYQNDTEFREKTKQQALQNFHKTKVKKQNNKEIEKAIAPEPEVGEIEEVVEEVIPKRKLDFKHLV